MGIYFCRVPTGEPGRVLIYWVFERWIKGTPGKERLSLSEEAQCGRPVGRAPLLVTL
jgi:hypothetical protein